MRKIIKWIDGLTPLNVPVPPILAKAIGYIEEAWYISFQWTPYGYQAVYSDGRLSGTCSWMVFHAYIRHPAVSPFLQEYDLGNPIADICATLGISKRTLYRYTGA